MKRVGVLAAAGFGLALVGVGLAVALYARQIRSAEAQRRESLAAAAAYDLEHHRADEALQKLRALKQLEPERPGLEISLGRALVSTGAAQEAEAILSAAARGTPNAEALEYLGVSYAMLGRLPEAKATLEKAVEAAPNRVSALRRLAQTQLGLGEVNVAVATWQRALLVAPPEVRSDVEREAASLFSAAGHDEAAKAFSETVR
jgi:tetratricopeptide (TPR) repeat protein